MSSASVPVRQRKAAEATIEHGKRYPRLEAEKGLKKLVPRLGLSEAQSQELGTRLLLGMRRKSKGELLPPSFYILSKELFDVLPEVYKDGQDRPTGVVKQLLDIELSGDDYDLVRNQEQSVQDDLAFRPHHVANMGLNPYTFRPGEVLHTLAKSYITVGEAMDKEDTVHTFDEYPITFCVLLGDEERRAQSRRVISFQDRWGEEDPHEEPMSSSNVHGNPSGTTPRGLSRVDVFKNRIRKAVGRDP